MPGLQRDEVVHAEPPTPEGTSRIDLSRHLDLWKVHVDLYIHMVSMVLKVATVGKEGLPAFPS
jgi:hypothetical protein